MMRVPRNTLEQKLFVKTIQFGTLLRVQEGPPASREVAKWLAETFFATIWDIDE